MTPSCVELAERASFDAFLNCYLRESNAGHWHEVDAWCRLRGAAWSGPDTQVVELLLDAHRLRLAVGIVYRSQAGRHSCGTVKLSRGAGWEPVDKFWALLLLCRELTHSACTGLVSPHAQVRETEMMMRLLQSQQLMTTYIERRTHDASCFGEEFIQSEQSLLYGHWLHPTPKSRQGAADWQQARFSPELQAQFCLHYFAVPEANIAQDSNCRESADRLVANMLCRMGCATIVADAWARGERLIPVHPLQAEWLKTQPYVERALSDGSLRELGPLGDAFAATSSVRTVYRADCDWMLKFSVPLKITNSLRVNQPKELVAGVVMSRVFSKLGFSRRNPRFQLLSDPAYMRVEVDGVCRAGFDVILRENPFMGATREGVHCVASLVQNPIPHHPSRLKAIIDGLALAEGRRPNRVSEDWFERYMRCSIEPTLRLYDQWGVALEAHQQNVLLNVAFGYPTCTYIRDNQGFYLSRSLGRSLLRVEPQLESCPELFYDDELIRARLSYYLISNQLFSVVWRLGCDGLLDEENALDIVVRRLELLQREFTGPAATLVASLLEEPTLPHKANLLTRMFDIDELTAVLEQAVYTTVENPISGAQRRRFTQETVDEVA